MESSHKCVFTHSPSHFDLSSGTSGATTISGEVTLFVALFAPQSRATCSTLITTPLSDTKRAMIENGTTRGVDNVLAKSAEEAGLFINHIKLMLE